MNILEMMKTNKSFAYKHSDEFLDVQKRAKNLCWEFNQTSPDEDEKRSKILKELFGTCHPSTAIEPTFRCDYGFNIHTHGFTLINYNCTILDTSPVHIGANAFIAPGVCLACSGHAIDSKQRTKDAICTSKPITLEDDVWIGANTVVCGGVTIGRGSVIGAGSVVTKDIPENVIAVGNPCRVIRKITEKDKINPLEIIY